MLESIVVIPNDFKNLSRASNLGMPIAVHAPKSPATQAIQKLAMTLGGKKNPENRGLLGQFLSKLLSGD
jgi:pilus assembly protein CpaE